MGYHIATKLPFLDLIIGWYLYLIVGGSTISPSP